MDTTPLQNYELGREIGSGSFAKVYLGQTLTLPHKVVAVKSVLRSKLTKKLLENLESEISILKGIKHPHIVTLIDITNTGSHIHLIMEYCPLGDLSYFIKKREKLGLPGQIPLLNEIASNYPNVRRAGLNEILVKHFLQQLASALAFLRSKNLIHRDVKPQNLLLQPPVDQVQHSGVGLAHLPLLKLADFGFARYLQTSTMAETLCGSPLYMAPEILRYEKYDATADLWSVGTVLYEMLVGKPPFGASNPVELLKKIDMAKDMIKFPLDVVFNDDLQTLVKSLLRRNPKDRISFDDFFSSAAVREPLRAGSPSVTDPQTTLENSMMIRPGRRDHVPSPAFITDLIPVNTPPAPKAATAGSLPRPLNAEMTQQGKKSERLLNRGQSFREQRAGSSGLGFTGGSSVSKQESPQGESSKNATDLRDRRIQRTAQPPDANASPGTSRNEHSVQLRKEKERESEGEYVVVEKRMVEMNAFADAMARSPRLGQMSRRRPSTFSRASPPLSSPDLSDQMPNNATVQALATAERRLGSSPTSALAKALSIANQRLFGGGSPPSWLEQMVNNAVQLTSPSTFYNTKSDACLWSTNSASMSSEEFTLISALEGLSIKSTVVYDFGELKLRQLIPPPPSQSDDRIDGLLTNEAVVSLCEEAVALYLKTLQLLQQNIDSVQAWLARGSSRTPSPQINDIVQWTRDRYNEVLEKAEYLQHKKNTTLALVGADYPFDTITAEKLLYDRALELGRGAAVHEIVGEDLSQCEGDYEASVLMLEAILITGLSASTETGDKIVDDDRAVIERWVQLTKKRLEKLREKIDQMKASPGLQASLGSGGRS
ncbi:Serine/threonine protein kinase [Taphrina deformans PYCC 5710]|uniref:non-specific serine/threonine protein kinase n=1 Tax=Taphrina deformans (strain PYCC 5710 / ATCC 11124 / CBS 356.35 / IMI 108563 / JCM 9778 / NBRC 8474) TaxID=1097556 RepID=R4XCA9_TAPDE|nr:Serine/threonine protein kinase [Taphrina deformans PYCC 5710]|eukprot:CCG83507.1 Serine/threonine protein kinase [Taphrina deformans PYCC 5710]